MMRFNFERERQVFIDNNMSRLPKHWRMGAIKKFLDIEKKQNTAAAAAWLRVLIEPLENLLNIAHDDGDIKALADELASKCRESVTKYDRHYADIACGGYSGLAVLSYMQELCAGYAVRWPGEFDNDGILKRMTDNLWWLRKLRESHAKAREVAAINAGLVHRKAGIYVSDDTLDRRAQQKRRNQKTLEGVNMQSESGQVMKLSGIAAAGVANPENRRAELMTRVTGFEALSVKYGHMAEFVTVTCPSRMHAVLRDGKTNPKYDGTKPGEAQAYLVEVWARVRAKFHRDGFKFYGLRVAEPHHDATPHWHLILFYKPEKITLKSGKRIEAKHYMRGVIRSHFMLDSIGEAGADENRVKFVSINPLRGTAAGYVVKYVCKNIDGIDDTHIDEIEGKKYELGKGLHNRVDAWASTWRIRQFQQVGGHSVTVWRELRRVDQAAINPDFRELMRAWRAVQKISEKQKASFAEFIEAMGGLGTRPRDSVVALDDDYVMRRGRYGEAAARVVKGVRLRFGFDAAANNRESWVRV